MQHYPPRIQNEIPLDEISRIIGISEAKSSDIRKNKISRN